MGPFLGPCPPSISFPNNNATTAALAFGPWAYWKLAEANGVTPAVDSSGHGRSMTVLVSNVQGGKAGLIKTGPDTCSFVVWTAATNVEAWQSQAAQTWTPAVGTWVYWINSPGHSTNELDLGCLGTLSSATSRLFRHFLNSSGQPVIEFQDTLGTLHTLTFAVGVVDNSTHMLAFVLDGTNVSVYVDGAFVSSQAQGATMKSPFTATAYIGQPAGGAGSRFYTGLIGPVGWYDQVLTGANILTLYQKATQSP